MDFEDSGSVPRPAYGGRYCAVFQCHNNHYKDIPRGIRFHLFPKDPERRQQWVKAVNRRIPGKPTELWQPKNHDIVCSEHFVGGKKSNDKNSPSYIPSIFPTHTVTPKSASAIARAKRLETREKRSLKRKRQKLKAKVDKDQPSVQRHEDPVQASNQAGAGSEDDQVQNIAPPNDTETEPMMLDDDLNADEQDHMEDGMSNKTELDQTLSEKSEEAWEPIKIPYGIQVNEKRLEAKKRPSSVTFYCDMVSTTEKATQITSVEPEKKKKVRSRTTQTEKDKKVLPFDSFNERQLTAFCGVSENMVKFLLFKVADKLKDSKSLSRDKKMILFLARLKLFVSYQVLGAFFGISECTAANFFRDVLNAVYDVAKDNIIWFEKETIIARMPAAFRACYPDTRVIIDCSEIEAERPPKVRQRVLTYSSYKSRYTVKFLIGIAPSGEITFISQCYGGRITDTQITVNSGFIELLEEGDVVLADKGFPTIEKDVNKAGGILVMPPFKSGERQFSEKQNHDGYKIASVRVHVERCIARIKCFEILNHVPIKMMPYIDRVLTTICFLNNCSTDLIKQ